jgi:cytochrome c oxidase subunit 4
MEHAEIHISKYSLTAKVLVTLLILTMVTVAAAWFNFGKLNIIIAMAIASFKVFLVLTYFMHLKYEKLVFRLMVGMVFILLALIFIFLFFDYWFR